MGSAFKALNYDDRMQTPRGTQYSMFRNVGFEEVEFHRKQGLSFRLRLSRTITRKGNIYVTLP